MTGVREWATMICLAALSAAMLQSLIPNGSMERMAKFVIGAFVICALIAPVSKVVPQIHLDLQKSGDSLQKNSRLSSEVNRQYQEAAQQSIAGVVRSELQRMGTACKNVRVMMDTDSSGSISINKVIVTVDSKTALNGKTISSNLEKILGIKTEVVSDEG